MNQDGKHAGLGKDECTILLTLLSEISRLVITLSELSGGRYFCILVRARPALTSSGISLKLLLCIKTEIWNEINKNQ